MSVYDVQYLYLLVYAGNKRGRLEKNQKNQNLKCAVSVIKTTEIQNIRGSFFFFTYALHTVQHI